MKEMVRIRSAEEYFKEYGRDGIGKGADKWMIRRQLIDAFHKEMFGLIALRTKKGPMDISIEKDPESMRIAKNVIKDTMRKWEKLCRMFEKYKETHGVLKVEDLKLEEEEEPREEHAQ